MSAFEEYEEEKREIDALLEAGYRIAGVNELLDGADVLFAGKEAADRRRLLLQTADARKYLSYRVIAQQRAGAAQG